MDFDSKELTLRQAAEIYATQYAKNRKGFDTPQKVQSFVSATVSKFKDVADEPGSAVQLFIPDENDKTVLRKLFEGTPADDQPTKKAMQNLRLIGHFVLKAGLKSTDELYEFMPDSAVRSDKNERIFGRLEPAKGESLVAINPDREIQKEFFAKLSAKAANPETRKATLAALFLLNTGVRPEIIENLRFDHYNAKKGALYIPGDISGAKGRAINIPLNPLADAIIQEFMKERIDGGLADPDGPNLIFFKYSKVGNKPPIKLETGDVTSVLRDIEVGNNTDFGLIYDEKTQRHYTSLTPPELAKNKSGSRLLRNFHATLGDRLFGIPAERLAYLEGRTLKSVRKNLQTGSLEVYQVTFPFDVNEDDRAFASRFAAFTQDAAGDLGLDFTRVMNLEAASETRIFGDDPRYETYFKSPESLPEKIDPADTINESDAKKLRDMGWDDLFGVGAAAGLTGAAVVFGDPEEVMAGAIAETTAEQSTRSLTRGAARLAGRTAVRTATGAALGPPGVAAVLAGEAALPSASAGPGELNVEEAMQLETARLRGDIGLEKELMARTPITEIGGDDTPTVFGQRVTRQPPTDDLTFGFIQRQDALKRRRERNKPLYKRGE